MRPTSRLYFWWRSTATCPKTPMDYSSKMQNEIADMYATKNPPYRPGARGAAPLQATLPLQTSPDENVRRSLRPSRVYLPGFEMPEIREQIGHEAFCFLAVLAYHPEPFLKLKRSDDGDPSSLD